ncbi:hypothetical protein Q5752_005899 [Cryptotrichosporon argae]
MLDSLYLSALLVPPLVLLAVGSALLRSRTRPIPSIPSASSSAWHDTARFVASIRQAGLRATLAELHARFGPVCQIRLGLSTIVLVDAPDLKALADLGLFPDTSLAADDVVDADADAHWRLLAPALTAAQLGRAAKHAQPAAAEFASRLASSTAADGGGGRGDDVKQGLVDAVTTAVCGTAFGSPGACVAEVMLHPAKDEPPSTWSLLKLVTSTFRADGPDALLAELSRAATPGLAYALELRIAEARARIMESAWESADPMLDSAACALDRLAALEYGRLGGDEWMTDGAVRDAMAAYLAVVPDIVAGLEWYLALVAAKPTVLAELRAALAPSPTHAPSTAAAADSLAKQALRAASARRAVHTTTTDKDVVLHGLTIPAGSRVVLTSSGAGSMVRRMAKVCAARDGLILFHLGTFIEHLARAHVASVDGTTGH